ncbi:MAG TPA: ABC transporter permease, partial [bacterium]|nr:ABC transporter permease [bacterium]
MSRYILRRAAALLPILLGVSIISFLMIHLLPADPAVAYLGEHATPEAIVRVRHEFGLDRPLPVQYGVYIADVVRGNFGDSLDSHRPVLVEFAPRFPATVELTFGAITIALLVGIPVGLMSAARPNSILDRLGMAMALTGVSMPVFWL